MKPVAHVLIFLLATLTVNAQRHNVPFTLSDSTFIVGSVYTGCDVWFSPDGRSNLREESYPCLDSFAAFMLQHPGLIVEVAYYTDQQGDSAMNLIRSQVRANKCKERLVAKGVDPSCLVAVGYGRRFPIWTLKQIKAEKDKNRQTEMELENLRTEFRILRVPVPAFTLKDSVFAVGEVLRMPITFDMSKPSVRRESMPLIDSLAAFLKAHPQLVVEVGNHTDSRGSNKYSMNLSEGRARSVADSLLARGVPASQVIYKGYADTQAIVRDTEIYRTPSKEGQEQFHQLNRRTEIRIVQINDGH